jgi:hypothetical protein
LHVALEKLMARGGVTLKKSVLGLNEMPIMTFDDPLAGADWYEVNLTFTPY